MEAKPVVENEDFVRRMIHELESCSFCGRIARCKLIHIGYRSAAAHCWECTDQLASVSSGDGTENNPYFPHNKKPLHSGPLSDAEYTRYMIGTGG